MRLRRGALGRSFVVAVSTSLAGCGSDAPSSETRALQDNAIEGTAGDVSNSLDTDSTGSSRIEPVAYVLADVPTVTVGGQDNRPTHQFQYTMGAVRLSNGRIVIADAGSRDLRYFDEDGRHLMTVGGTGEGPGEFRNLRTIARIHGDTIVAWDAAGRQLSFFTGGGEFALRVNFGGWSNLVTELSEQYQDAFASISRVHVLETGTIIVEPAFEQTLEAMEETRVIQDTVPLYVFNREGQAVRSLGNFPASEKFVRNRAGSLLRFGERLSIGAGSDLVFVGSTRGSRIQAISPSGEVVRTIPVALGLRSIAPDDIPAPGTGLIGEHMAAMPVPDAMPLFGSIRQGGDGQFWVQKYVAPNDQEQEWLGFDGDGIQIATLSLDASMTVLEIGRDYLIVLAIDELDVEEVRVYPLVMG